MLSRRDGVQIVRTTFSILHQITTQCSSTVYAVRDIRSLSHKPYQTVFLRQREEISQVWTRLARPAVTEVKLLSSQSEREREREGGTICQSLLSSPHLLGDASVFSQ